ncbi:diguanylate cyclase [Sulfurimonas sp.]|uniref:GGDEF domain-containing protein n=1 Tax=Sulfurimonas sp. TaxID=2022749 RepID=UPI0026303BF2|nr:diguanylate cyclase [Sulfurimonas sp.]
MKHSIKNIFKNLSTYLFFVFFVAFLALMLVLEQKLSFDKMDTLNNDKTIIKKLVESHEKDMELALIQFNAQSTKLLQNVDKLRTLYKYNMFEKLILQNSTEYMQDLNKLDILIQKFNTVTHKYYIQEDNSKIKDATREEHLRAFKALNEQLNNMLFKAMKYNQEKFELIKYLVAAAFFLIFIATFWYRKALNSIYEDINYLFQLDKTKADYNIYSIEADAIALRMNRKNQMQDNPHLIDPVTGINNYKGLLHSYSHKKSLKDSNFTSVSILEIDNFSKSKRVFTQEIAQAMLKKVAYTISLHEQPIDVIARTDYNQFTLVLSRTTKEQAFKEVDLIRESISELKFNIPDYGPTQITVTGAFVIKPNNSSIEEALKQATEILEYAKSMGKNKILQIRDLAQRDI